MNILELKGKRVASGLKQRDVAKKLGITHKTFCIYENSAVCKFLPEQISIMADLYKLDVMDVNKIFFDNELPNGTHLGGVSEPSKTG